MSRAIAALAACLLFSGVVLAGCGGGDDQGTTAGSGTEAVTSGDGQAESGSGGEPSGGGSGEPVKQTSITKTEFVAKAKVLCDTQRQQLNAELRRSLKGGQGSQQTAPEEALLQAAEDLVAPAMEAEAEGLRALGAPAGDVKQVEAVVAALEAIAAKGREDPAGLVANTDAFAKAQILAREYGIGGCGRTI